MNRGIPGVLARGGSSRGIIVLRDDLQAIPRSQWAALFAHWLGSPDPSGRQVDGAGGGNPSTSKVVVLGASDQPGRDLDYEFYQIDPVTGAAECRGTCGNLTAAVGLFAVGEGLVPVTAPETVVRLRDTNTGKDIDVRVPLSAVSAGTPPMRTVAPGKASALITTTFLDPAGAVSGSLFPTGSPRDTLQIDGRTLTVTLIDAVNPVALVDGTSLGTDPDRPAAAIEADGALMATLAQVRSFAAVAFGLATSVEQAPEQSPFLPFVGVVFPPRDYTAASGAVIPASDVDVVVRMLSGPTVHRALPLSAGLATAAAAALDGAANSDHDAGERRIRLGHPSGVLEVAVVTSGTGVERISVSSTARVILRGFFDIQ